MAIISMTYKDIDMISGKLKNISKAMKDLSNRLENLNKSVKTVKDFELYAKSILSIHDALDDQIEYVGKLKSTLDSIALRYKGSEINAGKIIDDINDDLELKSIAAAASFTEVIASQIIAAAQYIWSTLYPGDTASQDVSKLMTSVLAQDTEAIEKYVAGKAKELQNMAYNVVNAKVQQVSFGALTFNDLATISDEKIAYLKSAVGAYKDNYYQLEGRQDNTYILQGAKVNNYFDGLLKEVESKK